MSKEKFVYPPNESECEAACNAYLVSLVVAVAGTPIPILITLGSVIYYFNIPKEKHFAKWHSLQAILSQLAVAPFNSVFIAWLISIVFNHNPVDDYFIAYGVFVFLINVLEFVGNSLSAIAVRKGIHYRYWVIGQLTDMLYPWKRLKEVV